MIDALETYWPLILVTGSGLVAWGRLGARIDGLRKDVDSKVSKEVLAQVDTRLTRMEEKLDRLLERE